MKKKIFIIIAICIFVICLAVAVYFTVLKMDYTETENGYTTSYRGVGKSTLLVKIEKETPFENSYFYVRNNDGDILDFEIKEKTENKIIVIINGKKEGTGTISLYMNDDPNGSDEVIFSGEKETTDNQNESLDETTSEGIAEGATEVLDEEDEIDTLLYSANFALGVEEDLKIWLLDCGVYTVKDPELIFEKGEFKLFAQKLDGAYRLIIPDVKKNCKTIAEGFGIINIADTKVSDDGKEYVTIFGERMGKEKVLVSSPYDNVNVVLQFETISPIGENRMYSINLVSYDGADNVDISMFFDGIDYTLMATTLDKLPIPISANINEYNVLSKSYDEGNEICTINLVYNSRKINYVVSEKVTMDELLVDINQLMTSANIPLKEETIKGTKVRSYEYTDGTEIFSIVYFTIENDNCMLTSEVATVEELKAFVRDIQVKDLSIYKEVKEEESNK